MSPKSIFSFNNIESPLGNWMEEIEAQREAEQLQRLEMDRLKDKYNLKGGGQNPVQGSSAATETAGNNVESQAKTGTQKGIHVKFYDREGKQTDQIPSELQQHFKEELGMKFIYDREKELLFYDESYEHPYYSEEQLSDSRHIFRDRIDNGESSQSIIFGYDLYYKDYAGKEEAVNLGINISIDKKFFGEEGISLIDINDFHGSGLEAKGWEIERVGFKLIGSVFNWRAFNLMRTLEHEWIGHGLLLAGHEKNSRRQIVIPGKVDLSKKHSAQSAVDVLANIPLKLPQRVLYGITVNKKTHVTGTVFADGRRQFKLMLSNKSFEQNELGKRGTYIHIDYKFKE